MLHRATTNGGMSKTADARAERVTTGMGSAEGLLQGTAATCVSKVGGGEIKHGRGTGLKPRPAEAWKAARDRRNDALTIAARSAECRNRSRQSFERLHNLEDMTRPYPEVQNMVDMTEERKAEIRSTFQFLRQSQEQPKGKIVQAKISSFQLASRLQFLKEKSFVLYSVDISPSRDAVAAWAETNLQQEMDIKVVGVRALNRNCYRIMVEEDEDRYWVLDAAPLFLGPHMVFALPWDPQFDAANLDKAKVPIWWRGVEETETEAEQQNEAEKQEAEFQKVEHKRRAGNNKETQKVQPTISPNPFEALDEEADGEENAMRAKPKDQSTEGSKNDRMMEGHTPDNDLEVETERKKQAEVRTDEAVQQKPTDMETSKEKRK
ncbi:hypothetical protein R1sor_009074 [Riccia sorocarpa]|uniref:Uncharacterized protein n=1 Tax=Riccia sorocarpa TaxID=122646 RepID=A0ABD3H806_9MARC